MVDKLDTSKIKEIAQRYSEVLRKYMNLKSLFLFGSTVRRGEFREDSDIDIAVISDDFSGNLIEDTFKLMKLRRNIDTRIEPHPFTVSEFAEDNPFVNEIINTGIKIY